MHVARLSLSIHLNSDFEISTQDRRLSVSQSHKTLTFSLSFAFLFANKYSTPTPPTAASLLLSVNLFKQVAGYNLQCVCVSLLRYLT